jgi:hypothetical protein
MREGTKGTNEARKDMNHKERDSQPESPWECIDPSLGSCMWELDLPDTPEERASHLRAHLDLCEGCRLDQALTQRLEKGLADGELRVFQGPDRVVSPKPWFWRPAALATAGSSLLAACLALLIFLPPQPAGDVVNRRGTPDEVRFLRPVEGEVVLTGATSLSWSPVDGATSYKVTLTDVDGEVVWEETTTDTRLEFPASATDSGDKTLRAILATVPADLVSPGQISVSFRTGNTLHVAWDRLAKAPPWLGLLALAGVVFLGLGQWFSGRGSKAGVKL